MNVWIKCTMDRTREISDMGLNDCHNFWGRWGTNSHPAGYRPTVKSISLPRRSAAHYCRYSVGWWVFDGNHPCCRLRPSFSSRWHSVFLRWLMRCETRYRWSDTRWRVLLSAREWPLTTTTSRLLPVKTHFTDPGLVRNSGRVSVLQGRQCAYVFWIL